jgi:hypothetical protein
VTVSHTNDLMRARDLQVDPEGILWERRFSRKIGWYEVAKRQDSARYRMLLIAVQARKASCNAGDWHYWVALDGKTVCRRFIGH